MAEELLTDMSAELTQIRGRDPLGIPANDGGEII